ncbi:RNA-binding Raly-like protein isoform X2 [Passer domesticus]|uniref:RNA-binding Raly-like protein isoform X2 n=1 Tax=Passer domesticus TaxID=48849 RepID=UPI0030FF2C03
MGPVVPVLSPAAHGNRSPEEAGAALLRHDWAQSDCNLGARHGSTPSCAHTGAGAAQGNPPAAHVAPAAAVPWSWRYSRGCPCLPCLPAGVLRAPTLSRSCGRGTPAHTEESGLASRADGEPGGGLPLPCAHTRYPREQSPIPRRISGRDNPGAHASEPGAAPGPPPGAPHPSPGQTPALRSARRRPHSRGERRCSGGAGAPRPEGNRRAVSGDKFALRRRASCAAAQDAPASAPRPHGRLRARARRQRVRERSGAEQSVSERGGSGTCRGQRRRGALGGGEAGRLRRARSGAERAGLGLGPRPAPPLRPPGCESARLRITWRLPEAETREERKKKRLIPSSTAILYFIVTLIFIPPFYSRSI